MAWFKRLFGFGHASSDTEILDRYRAARAMSRDLQIRMIKELPKPALPECAKKLGLVKSGTLIINQDDEIAIAYDYCLHHFRRAGKNVIERTLETSADEKESAWLDALTPKPAFQPSWSNPSRPIAAPNSWTSSRRSRLS